MLRPNKIYLFNASLGFALLTSTLAQASPTLVTGTAGDSTFATPTLPSPLLSPGTLFNFDSLDPNTTFASDTYKAQGVTSISSPDGLEVYPYSGQSAPNYLYDTSADGSADITINLSSGADAIGIGIADSDALATGAPVTITLQALDQNGNDLGAAFNVTTPTDGTSYGNGYYVVEDSAFDIYGLEITQPVGDAADFSGLAIDDLQVQVPEPSSWALCLIAIGIMFGLRRRFLRA